jgi:hypothetical protein
MIATCAKCGHRHSMTPTGINSFTLGDISGLSRSCPVVAARLKEKGQLSADEMCCDHLARAGMLALDRLQKEIQARAG